MGFVFGPERFGLANDDVYRCHAVLTIPTPPDYGSLNLAQAVQIVAYEWRQALGGYAVVPATKPPAIPNGISRPAASCAPTEMVSPRMMLEMPATRTMQTAPEAGAFC